MDFNHRLSSVRALVRTCVGIATITFTLMFVGCKDEVSNVNNVTTVYTSADLTNPAIMPAVTSTYPATGTTGPFNIYTRASGTTKAHFILTFNKLITRSSVTSDAVRVTGFGRPVVAFLQGGRTVYDNVLSFTLRDSISGAILPYSVGTSINVIIDTTITDINGNRLMMPFSFVFYPEPFFRVVGVYPLDGATDVFPYASPQVFFNSRVDGTILSSLSLNPNAGGTWRTVSSDSFYVRYAVSGGELPYNIPYTITLNSNAHDAAGNTINGQYTSHFSSIPFKVTFTSPYDGQPKVALNPYIEMYFPGILDSGTVRSAFSLSPTSPGTFSTSLSTYFYYNCSPTSLHQNTTYTASVNAGLKAADGTAATPYSFTFTTDAFNVQYSYPGDGSINIDLSASIQISFNANIDGSTVATAFSISPTVAGGSFDIFTPTNTIYYYHTSSPFLADTTYTVTISTAMKTNSGDQLLVPYTFSFKTSH